MTDATVLIPTHRHPTLVSHAVRSALDQRGASVEVFVVGDGVEDDTRKALRPVLEDERVRFFDSPKGPRHGEVLRHEALQEARGEIVCYLSDDDLLLPSHVAGALGSLEDADFSHGPPAWLEPDGGLQYFPWDLGRPDFAAIARMRKGSIGLTGIAHTLTAYRRLPFGWRTTPAGVLTDHYMWLQWLDLPGFRGRIRERLTYLWFPSASWDSLAVEEREAALADWLRRSREPDFEETLQALLLGAIRRSAEDFHLWALRERRAHAAVRATRAWRLRELLVRRRLLRALLARPPRAR